jgi:uncharacterized protein YjbI with pentapeptide repeats
MANMRRANLVSADLENADLTLADLSESNLKDVFLLGANTKWTDFSSTDYEL